MPVLHYYISVCCEVHSQVQNRGGGHLFFHDFYTHPHSLFCPPHLLISQISRGEFNKLFNPRMTKLFIVTKLTQGGGVIWTPPFPHRFSKWLQIKDQALA